MRVRMNEVKDCTIGILEDDVQLLREREFRVKTEVYRRSGYMESEAGLSALTVIRNIMLPITSSCNTMCISQNIRNSYLCKDRQEIPSSIPLFKPVVRQS